MRQAVTTGKPWESTISHRMGWSVAGRVLHTSGIVARDGEGNIVGPGDMRAQIDQIHRNLGDIFAAAGTGWDRVIKLVWYATDIAACSREVAARKPFMPGNPASTLVEVTALVRPEFVVEVEAIVALG